MDASVHASAAEIFLEHLAVAAATVLRASFTADEELRDSCAYDVAEHFWRFGFSFDLHLCLG